MPLTRATHRSAAHRGVALPGAPAASGIKPVRYGKSIGFVGALSGVGTTSTLLNVALVLSSPQRTVVAAEICPSRHSFASHLGLTPRHSLGDLLASGAAFTPGGLDSCLTSFSPGLLLLPAPPAPLPAHCMDEDVFRRLLNALAERGDYVLVDLPTKLPDVYQRMVRHLDHVVLLVDPYRDTLQASREVIARLQSWGIGSTRLSAIVVKKEIVDCPEVRSEEEVQNALGIPISGVVPPAQSTSSAASPGAVPVVLASLAIARIAEELLSEVDHMRLRVAMVTGNEEAALRLQKLLQDADPIHFDVSRATEIRDVLAELTEGAFDVLILVLNGTGPDIESLMCQVMSRAERTAVVLITTGDDRGASCAGVELGAQEHLGLDRLDSYWLSHAIRSSIERQRVVARLEREARDLASCDVDLRRLVARLLRETQHDPRMV